MFQKHVGAGFQRAILEKLQTAVWQLSESLELAVQAGTAQGDSLNCASVDCSSHTSCQQRGVLLKKTATFYTVYIFIYIYY